MLQKYFLETNNLPKIFIWQVFSFKNENGANKNVTKMIKTGKNELKTHHFLSKMGDFLTKMVELGSFYSRNHLFTHI
jgi:hypothetical protein